MSDLVKYRSYNENKKQWFWFASGRYYDVEDLSHCISERICSEFWWNNAEQMTDTQDIKGKDIYAGDKCKVFVNDMYIDEDTGFKASKDKKIESIWTIEWVNHQTYVGFKSYGKDRRFNVKLTGQSVLNNQMEIVGNIRENRELLK